jgi:predicted nucleotidyltransferase
MSPLAFPTTLHQRVADLTVGFFTAHETVDTVLAVNSCARGQATPASDLDLAVLVGSTASAEDARRLEASWQVFAAGEPLVREFKAMGPFAHVHLDVFDGRVVPSVWDEGGGPDAFEVEIGNRVAHAVPLHAPGPRFQQLQATWLPYYSEKLRASRLAMVRHACIYDLDHLLLLHRRGLYVHAFDRLYKAVQEFLQALLIARRTYPLAYNKWIREQVEGWLGMRELYRALLQVLSVPDLERDDILEKAATLRVLLDRWIVL